MSSGYNDHMDVTELRARYSRLRYRQFEIKPHAEDLTLRFTFELESVNPTQYPDLHFHPSLTLHGQAAAFVQLDPLDQALWAFQLGLAELPSYWKAACPAEITLEALTGDQFRRLSSQADFTADWLRWWQTLLTYGLSEFYFVNDISEFTQPGFVTWKVLGSGDRESHANQDQRTGDTDHSPSVLLEYISEDLQTLETAARRRQQAVEAALLKADNNDFNVKFGQSADASLSRFLIPVGGGKDSIVTLGFVTDWLKNQLNQSSTSTQQASSQVQSVSSTDTRETTQGPATAEPKASTFVLNPIPAALAVSDRFGFEVFSARRVIDPLLLELNQQGFLNGHTPFSAYLAFVSTLVAELSGHDAVLLSNEQSANEDNTTYHGLPINHQYSKTTAFELDFVGYSLAHLPTRVRYCSLLRPITELKIAQLFERISRDFPQLSQDFLSCNVGGRQNYWCGHCPKCLFAYTLLYPFFFDQARTELVSQGKSTGQDLLREIANQLQERSRLFDSPLFEQDSLMTIWQDLLGHGTHKPLECVGLYEETLLSAWKAIELHRSVDPHGQLPILLNWVEQKIATDQIAESELERSYQQLLSSWLPTPTTPRTIQSAFQTWSIQKGLS